jgi:hypothetical protein
MFKVTLDSPTLGKGESVTVTGLGELKNGETVELDNAAEETFRMANASVGFDDEGQPQLVKGPTLRQAFRKNPTVKVEFVKDKASDPDPVVDEDEETVDETPENNDDGGVNA